MAAHLIIAAAGPGTTVQDGGRFGWLRFGVTPAGPMDWAASRTANVALGNAQDAAAIEVLPGGIAVEVDAPLLLAFAGAAFHWSHGDRALPAAARILLRPGERLRARGGASGSFAYLAVAGGLAVPQALGSAATHLRSGLGGVEGRALRTGDTLPVGAPTARRHVVEDAEIDAPWLAPNDTPLRIVLGPQDDHFTEAAIETLLGAAFTLSRRADRMAYVLEGPPLSHAGAVDIVSDGVALGAIQVAGDGRPMVLMADRQPTGGYPKIAHVIRADIGRLAQHRSGDACSFAAVTIEEATAALFALEDRIVGTREALRPLRRVPSAEDLLAANLVGGVTDGSD